MFAQVPRVEIVPTFENLGVVLSFSEAVESEHGVTMEIRAVAAEERFRMVHPLSHIDPRRFAGSAFNLTPDTRYEIRFRSLDFALDITRRGRTRSDDFRKTRVRDWHVSSVNGSDSNAGLSPARAFASLGRALSVASAGDRIVVHGGTYYEGDLFIGQSGTEAAPIVIEAARGAEAILDGTDLDFHPEWESFDLEAHIYRTECLVEPEKAYLDGEHFFRHGSLQDVKDRRWTMPGFFADGEHLYARFPGDAEPGLQELTIPRYTTGLSFVRKSHWQIRGLTFRCFGLTEFHRGIYLDRSDHVLIEQCRFEQNIVGVGLRRGADFNTIQDCHFDDGQVSNWDWHAVKSGASHYEGGGVFVYGSEEPNVGNVIRRNQFNHLFDGAHLYSKDRRGPSENLDFYDNVVSDCRDDAVETDGAGINCRIYQNKFDGFLTGVSVAPASSGPTYIFRNLFTGWGSVAEFDGYPVKFNSDSRFSTRFVYLYHNTCYTDVQGQNAFLFKRYSRWSDIISRNNIYVGTDYALESQSRANSIDFDYDSFFTTHSQRFIRWGGRDYGSLEDFSLATGLEFHGLSINPEFVDSGLEDFELEVKSPMIDRGVFIPGINDNYSGAAPDIGAYEFLSDAAIDERNVISAELSVTDGQFLIQFRGMGFGRYRVLSTTELKVPLSQWESLGIFLADESGGFVISDSLGKSQNYYRALLE